MALADVALAGARGLHDCGVLSALGVLVARVAGTAGSRGACRRLLRGSVLLAWIAGAAWLLLQAGEMSGAITLSGDFAAAPIALLHTGFGYALSARTLLLGVVFLLAGRRGLAARLVALLAAACAVIAQIRMGHAAAPDGPFQAQAAALHMLAAGVWIGGLLPLTVGLGADPVRVSRRFSLIGLAAVVILAATAFIQGTILVGGLPGLLGTDYGVTMLVKTGLFLVLLCFAALNRFYLSPALVGPEAGRAVIRLRRAIFAEAVVGVGAVLAAAWLSGLPPGAHEQPVWPLPWQPAWEALDDPDIVSHLQAGLGLLGVAFVSVFAALRWRRGRDGLWLFGAAAVLAGLWLIVPQLGAFVAPANPASFFESPTGFTKASVALGAAVYQARCAACHGPRGFGDGPEAKALAARPSPLTGFHLLEKSDGEMFWLVTSGIPAADSRAAMPGFQGELTEDQRWAVIDYVRALAGAEPGDSPAPSHHHH